MAAPKWMIGYAAGVTAALAATLLMGAAGKRVKFTEIDVERINIIEADGALRMTISNQGRFPELIWRGKEYKHPGRRAAGILFFNEEGTENGGLTFSGRTDENGVKHTTGHLSFDQYEQDQVFRIFHYQTGEATTAGMEVSDRPHKSMDMDIVARLSAAKTAEERVAVVRDAEASGSFDNKSRVFVGKSRDRSSAIGLMDAEGRPRIMMQVEADGGASISFLDAEGNVVRKLTPESVK